MLGWLEMLMGALYCSRMLGVGLGFIGDCLGMFGDSWGCLDGLRCLWVLEIAQECLGMLGVDLGFIGDGLGMLGDVWEFLGMLGQASPTIPQVSPIIPKQSQSISK